MRSFLAILWNARNVEADAFSKATSSRMMTATSRIRVSKPGLILHDLSDPGTPVKVFHSRSMSPPGELLAFGTLFPRDDHVSMCRELSEIPAPETGKAIASTGRSLLKSFWGNYVAFVRTEHNTAIISDPTGSIPCYVFRWNGVTFAFSHLERCHALETSWFSIDWESLTGLLGYDKAERQRTGLNDVLEVPGGCRLTMDAQGFRQERIWDPREFAKDPVRLATEDAESQLEHLTKHVVTSWASTVGGMSMQLSGGLDSCIVLSCLAGSAGDRPLRAHHFRLASDDVSELRYAEAAASDAKIPLDVFDVQPEAGLPALCTHPRSTRPTRQFFGAHGEHARTQPTVQFTGQGGDHLFLETKSTAVLADFLLLNGMQAETLYQLLASARLSGKSIWRVLLDTLRHVTRQDVYGRDFGHAPRQNASETTSRMGQSVARPTVMVPRRAPGIPPLKHFQVQGLYHMTQVRQSLAQAGGPCPTIIAPLISQPLMEYCLRVPTYTLCAEGISRGLARKAFRGQVPSIVLRRRSKGDASNYFIKLLSHHKDTICEALLDGELTKRGLLERNVVESYLRNGEYITHPFGRKCLFFYAAEAWVRTWTASAR